MQFPAEQGEQARFAATVGADQTDPPAGVNLDVGVDDQRAAGAGESDLAQCNHEGGIITAAMG